MVIWLDGWWADKQSYCTCSSSCCCTRLPLHFVTHATTGVHASAFCNVAGWALLMCQLYTTSRALVLIHRLFAGGKIASERIELANCACCLLWKPFWSVAVFLLRLVLCYLHAKSQSVICGGARLKDSEIEQKRARMTGTGKQKLSRVHSLFGGTRSK